MGDSSQEIEAIALIKGGLIPLYTCGAALTWALHDYFITVEKEIRYMWPGKNHGGKILFFWIRYYTLVVCLFDVAQIHSFDGFQPSLITCVAMDSVIRIVGALLLWPIEVVMQIRIYALYGCNKRIAILNAIFFATSVAGFLYVLVHNAEGRAAIIGSAKALPVPGCPTINTGIDWAQWVPATIFEGIMLFYSLAKSGDVLFRDIVARFHLRRSLTKEEEPPHRTRSKSSGPTLKEVVVQGNLLYFLGVTGLLILNNLMVVGATKIPWFSYGPFHAALGMMTGRLLINLRERVVRAEQGFRSSVEMSTLPTSGGSRPTRRRMGIGTDSSNVLTNTIVITSVTTMATSSHMSSAASEPMPVNNKPDNGSVNVISEPSSSGYVMDVERGFPTAS